MSKVELLPTRDCEAGYGPALLRKIIANSGLSMIV